MSFDIPESEDPIDYVQEEYSTGCFNEANDADVIDSVYLDKYVIIRESDNETIFDSIEDEI
jgi:hypothetical protein